MTDLNPHYLIETEEDLRALFPPTHEIAVKKCLDHFDKHVRAFIELSPFCCIGTQSPDGKADVSPRGDPAGFVKILNENTLLIPDRPGNNRLDTLSNITKNSSVGLLFLIPGFDETMRINGTARLTRDPELLAMLSVNGRVPTVAIVLEAHEVFIHCAKAFRRSKLWDKTALVDRTALPSLSKIVLDQTTGAPEDPDELRKLDDALEREYAASMY